MQTNRIYINEIKDKLIELDPSLILLFGSYAHGSPKDDSDIDLIVVTNDDFMPQTFTEKTALYLKVNKQIQEIAKKIPIDLLVYTKPMFQQFIDLQSSFSREILKKGLVLYEKNYGGMA